MNFLRFSSVLFIVGLSACASTPLGSTDTSGGAGDRDGGLGPDGGGGTVIPADGASLEFLGSSRVGMSENSETTVSVRYLDRDGDPVVNGTVRFETEGDTNGGTLSQINVASDASGIAEVNIRSAGAASFRLLATAAGTDGDQVEVNVTRGAIVTLRVTPEYAGDRRVGDVDIGLFSNFRCANFMEGSVPRPTNVVSTRTGDTAVFEGVDSETPASLYALGYTGDSNVAVFRCLDIADELNVTMDLLDIVRVEGGTFEMTETFDVTTANGLLDFILGAGTGLTTDPADWIIDLALDSGILPGIVEDILSDSRTLIGGYINQFIKDLNRPDYVDDIAEGLADLDEMLSNLTLAGTLSISEADGSGMGLAVHRLREMRVPLNGEVITRPLREQRVDDVVVRFVDREQTIEPHTFSDVPFGEIVGIGLNEVILPRLPDSPSSLTEVLDNLIDCEGLANRFGDLIDVDSEAIDEVIRDTTESGCDAGVRWAGRQLEETFTNLLNWNELTLSGTGRTTDGDRDFQADAFEGRAQASWAGGPGGTLDFTGDLEGARDGAASPRLVDEIAELFSTFGR